MLPTIYLGPGIQFSKRSNAYGKMSQRIDPSRKGDPMINVELGTMRAVAALFIFFAVVIPESGSAQSGALGRFAPAANTGGGDNANIYVVDGAGGWRTGGMAPGHGAVRILGGALRDVPAAYQTENANVYARGTDGSLLHWWYAPDGWHQETLLVGSQRLSSAPAAYDAIGSTANVYAAAVDGRLQHWWYAADGWHHEDLGGNVLDAPAAYVIGNDNANVYARRADGDLHHWWYAPDGWHQEEIDLGIDMASAPVAYSVGFNANVFATGIDGTLLHWWYADDGWHNENLGGDIVGTPSVFPGRAMPWTSMRPAGWASLALVECERLAGRADRYRKAGRECAGGVYSGC